VGYLRWTEQNEIRQLLDIASASGGLGQTNAQLEAARAELDVHAHAYPFLFIAAGLGLCGAILAFGRLGLLAGPVMLAGAVGPAIYSTATLLFSGFLVVGGLLSFLIRSRKRALARAERALQEGEQPTGALQVLGILAACFGGLLLLGYATLVFLGLSAAAAQQAITLGMIRGLMGSTGPGPRSNSPAGGFPIFNPEPREKESQKEIPCESIQGEFEQAGAGVKLVKLDLGPAGLDATLDAPEGCSLKKTYDGIATILGTVLRHPAGRSPTHRRRPSGPRPPGRRRDRASRAPGRPGRRRSAAGGRGRRGQRW
jgi:hypothetical protein